jgi:hypothetical protein
MTDLKQKAKDQATRAASNLLGVFFEWVRGRIQERKERRRERRDPDKTPAERPSKK